MKCQSPGCENTRYRRYSTCGPCKNSVQRYGLTVPERKSLLEEQGNACSICKKEISFNGKYTAVIDHCHTTGEIRGVLCHECNILIGAFERMDTQNALQNAADYVSSSRTGRYVTDLLMRTNQR